MIQLIFRDCVDTDKIRETGFYFENRKIPIHAAFSDEKALLSVRLDNIPILEENMLVDLMRSSLSGYAPITAIRFMYEPDTSWLHRFCYIVFDVQYLNIPISLTISHEK